MPRVLLVASFVALGGCYPDFQFGSDGGPSSGRSSATAGGGISADTTDTSSAGGAQATNTTSGAGGAQATTGSGGDMSTTASSTSSGPPPATTPCGPSQNQMLHACEPGQECCYDQTAAANDRCDSIGACDSDDYDLSCDEQSDCPPGGICCALYFELFGTYFDGSVGCYTTCPSPNRKVCKTSSDCGGGTCGPISALDSTYAQYYKVCQ